MTKNEFLEKLREALANDLTGSIIQENVDYYSGYINDEVNAGRDETEVVAELGDPWVLARTIIDTSDAVEQNAAYGQDETLYRQNEGADEVRLVRGGFFRFIITLLGIIGILFIIITVVGGIISFVAPILVPLLVIMFIIRRINQR